MADAPKKYAEQMVDWLVELGYTHCFFVAGGNIMHLLDAVRTRLTCIPVVHEVAAGMAAEYFNETADEGRKAFALVTAGPGPDEHRLRGRRGLAREPRAARHRRAGEEHRSRHRRRAPARDPGGRRRRRSWRRLTVRTMRIERPVAVRRFAERGHRRPGARAEGPVFLEVCLDAQAAPVVPDELEARTSGGREPAGADGRRARRAARRAPPGASGPCCCSAAASHAPPRPSLLPDLEEAGIPVMTTWNGADRVAGRRPARLRGDPTPGASAGQPPAAAGRPRRRARQPARAAADRVRLGAVRARTGASSRSTSTPPSCTRGTRRSI